MEGGNGATIGSGITHSPTGEQNVCPAYAHGGAGTRQSPAAQPRQRLHFYNRFQPPGEIMTSKQTIDKNSYGILPEPKLTHRFC